MIYKTPILVTLLLVASHSFAAKTTASVGAIAAISHIEEQETRSRILVNIEMPSLPENATVEFAQLSIPFTSPTRDDVTLTIEGYRVTTEWQAQNVEWSAPWETAGGDFDTLSFCTYTFSSALMEDIKLDITGIADAWNEGSTNHGLILSRPYYEGDSFGSEVEQLASGFEDAEVTIYYSTMPE